MALDEPEGRFLGACFEEAVFGPSKAIVSSSMSYPFFMIFLAVEIYTNFLY